MIVPFKYLDPYSEEDTHIFFGRETETAILSDLVSGSKITLVYGQSGTGKTSLVQAGLAKFLNQRNSNRLFVRRQENLNQSLLRSLINRGGEEETERNPVYAALNLVLNSGKPLYLIFDQFEELFILGDPEEENVFGQTLMPLLEPDLPVKCIFTLREEYLGRLYSIDRKIPGFFDNRLRLEPMSVAKAREMLLKTAEVQSEVFRFEGEEVVDKLIESTQDSFGKIQLLQLQVLLDQLFQKAREQENEVLVVDMDLLHQVGVDIGDRLRSFIQDSLRISKNLLGISHDIALQFLSPFVSLEGTRLIANKEDLKWGWGGIGHELVEQLKGFYIKQRILRNDESGNLELTHDILAQAISELYSEQMRLKASILNKIKFYYNDFQETGEYITKKQLKFLEPHLNGLALPEQYEAFVRQSQEVRKRRFFGGS